MAPQYCNICHHIVSPCPYCNSGFSKCPYCKNEPSKWTCIPLKDPVPAKHTRLLICGHMWHFDCYVVWTLSYPQEKAICVGSQCRSVERYYRNRYQCSQCFMEIGKEEYLSSAIILKCGFQYHSKCWQARTANVLANPFSHENLRAESFRLQKLLETNALPPLNNLRFQRALAEPKLSAANSFEAMPNIILGSSQLVPQSYGRSILHEESQDQQSINAALVRAHYTASSLIPTSESTENSKPNYLLKLIQGHKKQSTLQTRSSFSTSIHNTIAQPRITSGPIQSISTQAPGSNTRTISNSFAKINQQCADRWSSTASSSSCGDNEQQRRANSNHHLFSPIPTLPASRMSQSNHNTSTQHQDHPSYRLQRDYDTNDLSRLSTRLVSQLSALAQQRKYQPPIPQNPSNQNSPFPLSTDNNHTSGKLLSPKAPEFFPSNRNNFFTGRIEVPKPFPSVVDSNKFRRLEVMDPYGHMLVGFSSKGVGYRDGEGEGKKEVEVMANEGGKIGSENGVDGGVTMHSQSTAEVEELGSEGKDEELGTKGDDM